MMRTPIDTDATKDGIPLSAALGFKDAWCFCGTVVLRGGVTSLGISDMIHSRCEPCHSDPSVSGETRE